VVELRISILNKKVTIEFVGSYKIQFLIQIDFKFLSVVTFVGLTGFQSSSSLCTCICEIIITCQSYTFLTEIKVLANIDDVCIISDKSHSCL
jgi:hypothetical protein